MDDDWGGSGDELDGESDDEDGEKKKKKSNDSDDEGGKKKSNKKKKSKEDVNDKAFEDSDDGEGEGREVDYMSDKSSEEEEVEADKHNIKGVDMDEGLFKMLDSDESDEEEGEKKENEEDEETRTKRKKMAKRVRNPLPIIQGQVHLLQMQKEMKKVPRLKKERPWLAIFWIQMLTLHLNEVVLRLVLQPRNLQATAWKPVWRRTSGVIWHINP